MSNPTDKSALEAALAVAKDAKKGTVILKFNLKKAGDSRTLHSDGAWFGFDPAGRVRLSFFRDSRPLPNNFTMVADGAGNIVMDIPETPVQVVDREIEFEITLMPDVALQFYEGLGDNLKNMGKLSK
jgi:hypothetical protein